MRTTKSVDFLDRNTQQCPFAAYELIRQKGGVYRDPGTGFYILTDYETVRSLTMDNKRLANQTGQIGTRNDAGQAELDKIFREEGQPIRDVLVSADPPMHGAERGLVDKIFSPARVAKMETYLREVIDLQIDRFIGDGIVDFHNALSVIVPMTVIADQMGLPRSAEDIIRFRRWSEALALRSEPSVDHASQLTYAHQLCELQRFLLERIELYRADPADNLLSDLVHANTGGQPLASDHLVSIAMILVVAGNETTTSAISNAMIRLCEAPELQQRLAGTPQLIPQFIEESLRLDAPIQGLFRRALVDLQVGATTIPQGSLLVLKWGAANRDPARFESPEALQMDRSNVRQHLTFGAGPHFCVGNQLARSELRRTFEQVLRRMRNLRFGREEQSVKRRPHYTTFGVEELWIAFDRR